MLTNASSVICCWILLCLNWIANNIKYGNTEKGLLSENLLVVIESTGVLEAISEWLITLHPFWHVQIEDIQYCCQVSHPVTPLYKSRMLNKASEVRNQREKLYFSEKPTSSTIGFVVFTTALIKCTQWLNIVFCHHCHFLNNFLVQTSRSSSLSALKWELQMVQTIRKSETFGIIFHQHCHCMTYCLHWV